MRHIKRNRSPGTVYSFITLRCRLQNLTTIVDDLEGTMKDPFMASERALRRHQRSFGISYDQRLFDIAVSEKGHYLVYDNDKVMAYTIIR